MPEVELSSDIDDLGRWLDGIVASVNFELPGESGSLGLDLAGAVAEGIQVRTEQLKRSADGGSLKPNDETYAKRKEREYQVVANQPGVRTGQMLSLPSLLGETTVGTDEVVLRYGVNAPPDRTRAGGWLRESLERGDKKVTDRQKAGFFTDRVGDFYALDEGIANECVAVAGEAVGKMGG